LLVDDFVWNKYTHTSRRRGIGQWCGLL
jgi:hypothetical protein